MPRIVKALEDKDSEVRRSVVTAFGNFSKQCEYLILSSPQCLDLFNFFPAELVQDIQNAVRGIVTALEDVDLEVRRSAIMIIIDFAQHRE